MNNENNVNATQNPNEINNVTQPVSNTQPVAQTVANTQPVAQTVANTQPVQTEVLQPTSVVSEQVSTTTEVLTSTSETSSGVVAGPLNMPTVVNPLEVKADEVKPEVKPVVQPKTNPEDMPKMEKVSEYQEKLRLAQENYKPPSKFKMFTTIVMILGIILFGMFLPEISTGINKFLAGPGEGPAPDPITGTLICTLESNTANLDKSFTRKFKYEENKLKSAVIETSTRGDITLDEDTLNELNNKCQLISKSVENLQGVQVICEYTEGLLVERERFDYKSFDTDAIIAAYTEAGLTLVEFEYDADIDEIMKNMRQAGFTCNKE